MKQLFTYINIFILITTTSCKKDRGRQIRADYFVTYDQATNKTTVGGKFKEYNLASCVEIDPWGFNFNKKRITLNNYHNNIFSSSEMNKWYNLTKTIDGYQDTGSFYYYNNRQEYRNFIKITSITPFIESSISISNTQPLNCSGSSLDNEFCEIQINGRLVATSNYLNELVFELDKAVLAQIGTGKATAKIIRYKILELPDAPLYGSECIVAYVATKSINIID